ncbi:MAG: hypothetical protein ABI779_22960 [Acidobacteriota bacterium]
MKKFRFVALLSVLVAVLAFNVVMPPVAQAVASATPCTDRYNGCMAGGGGYEFCDGMWCGCMYSTYGYVC